jgi:hypothetical protein
VRTSGGVRLNAGVLNRKVSRAGIDVQAGTEFVIFRVVEGKVDGAIGRTGVSETESVEEGGHGFSSPGCPGRN